MEFAGNITATRRQTFTRFHFLGPASVFIPKETKTDVREFYLFIENNTSGTMIRCKPEDGPKVRAFALAVNVAARNSQKHQEGSIDE